MTPSGRHTKNWNDTRRLALRKKNFQKHSGRSFRTKHLFQDRVILILASLKGSLNSGSGNYIKKSCPSCGSGVRVPVGPSVQDEQFIFVFNSCRSAAVNATRRIGRPTIHHAVGYTIGCHEVSRVNLLRGEKLNLVSTCLQAGNLNWRAVSRSIHCSTD
jgi:hypothetical protein